MTLVNQAAGHHIEIVSFDRPNSNYLQDFPAPVHGLGGARRFGYIGRLIPWIRENRSRFDAVIVNGIWGYNCYGAWRALRGSGIPYFVYPHGMLDPWFKRTYPLKHLKKWIFWPWAVYPVLRDAAAVLFTCETERRLARESFWLYKCNEVVVNYGTPGAPDSQKSYAGDFLVKHSELQEKRRFVFLGRVDPKKGPDIVIKAFAQILAGYDPTFKTSGSSSEHSDFQYSSVSVSPMVLIMAGPAEGAYAAELKSLAETLGISDRVCWTGMLRGDDKWGALQCAEAFLLPSHQENFGIAVAESLSVGVPVLISKSVNIWADIVEAGAGIADEDSVEGCVRQWTQWLGLSTEARETMSARARTVFEQRYTSGIAAESLIKHITQAVKSA